MTDTRNQRPPRKEMRRLAGAGILSMGLLAACSSVQTLKPFATDGCSLFPDRALIGKEDWCSCCVVHDLAYWRGGTEEERLRADQNLKSCVQASTGNSALANLMFDGVRVGGGPYYFTNYRWGYGWPYGRMYQPLSEAESALADRLRADYLATNPTLACTRETLSQ